MKSIASLKSPTVLIVAGALVVGALGSKMLWTDSAPAIKVPIASSTPKSTAPSATHAVAANGQPRQNTRSFAQSKQTTVTVAAEASNSEASTPAPARRAVAQAQTSPQSTASPVAQQETQAPRPAPVQTIAEQDEAPSIARPPRINIAAAKRAQPSEVDNSSDTEGLFLISSLKDNQNGDAPANNAAPANAATNNTTANNIAASNTADTKQTAATSANSAQTTLSEPANTALAERVVTTAAGPAAAPGAVTDGLGPVFVDDANGYYLRFPAAWSIRKFDGEPWVIECGDGKSALMSVGFSPFPAEYTADNIPLDWVARRVKKRPDTVLNAQGYATIMGHKAIWSKSTGPMQMGGNQIKVIRTTYIIPLGDGRIAEIRIAAAPEQFDKIANVMKNAVSTFRLVPKRTPETQVAHIE